MSEEIGGIREAIGELRSSVETLMRVWGDQDRKANESRRELQSKFDELKDEVRSVADGLAQAIRDLKEMKPTVDHFEVARHRAAGARGAAKWIWGLISGGVLAIGYVVHDWLAFLFPPRH